MSALLETFRTNNSIQAAKFKKTVQSRGLFNLFLLRSLPMGFIAGLRVKDLSATHCAIAVPYRWVTQNPFKSTYFAVLAMAAEMSSGMLAMMHTYHAQPSVSMLVTGLEATFIKKATGLTTFTCADGEALLKTIEDCITTGEGKTYSCTAIGKSPSGEEVAKFIVTWSFKARK